ncbi:ATPase [Candidatus Vallotiella sp. (ex Adelges kitamiensis)]|uniref:ATPase n=1 Tax=Candidatus Vallotiella sp. (ex Adelges kitamiensis) TaxID=2864217 RepID=UPI001CE265D1|nr:ATPase [Candidatus Vallotia sp. (ex Adelges kitamiensis)]
MLTELHKLSQNIDLLIEISNRNRQSHLAVEEQLEDICIQRDALRAHLEQVQRERDALSAKIINAQVRLNAILEKLLHTGLSETPPDVERSQGHNILSHI